MKLLHLAMLIGLLTSCKSASQLEEVTSTPRSTRESPVEKTIGQTGQCSPASILGCLDAQGGYACFDRCAVKLDGLYCNMDKFEPCRDKSGGDACYKKFCGGKPSSGAFEPKSTSTALARLPKIGVGFEFYDVLQHAKPKTLERIMELSNRVFRKSGYPVYVGDMSNSSGGNSGRHAGHYDGVEVDIAVMGNTPKQFCGTFRDSCYNRAAMRVLIKEIVSMGGATSMYFNDPVLLQEFNQLSYVGGHDDHLHVNWHN